MENVWGALAANISSMTVMHTSMVMSLQLVQAAPPLGQSGRDQDSFYTCYSVATQTPLFLGKSVLVAGINIY